LSLNSLFAIKTHTSLYDGNINHIPLNEKDDESMNDSSNVETKQENKILEGSVFGNLMIPIAIVLVGALIIFGVTKMISTERSYKDLVNEMQSKTFGNRWIAAYELSKQITASQIPESDIPWLVSNLKEVFDTAKDPRTKEFIVVAMGALHHRNTISFLTKVLEIKDPKMSFHAIVAIGNMDKPIAMEWSKLESFLDSKDQGLQQAAILTLATHRITTSQTKIQTFLNHERASLRYSAAVALINFKDASAVSVLEEVLNIKTAGVTQTPKGQISPNDILGLKLNILHAAHREKWGALNNSFQKLADENDNKKVSLKAVEVLKLLKN
jgi:hypothetical protein